MTGLDRQSRWSSRRYAGAAVLFLVANLYGPPLGAEVQAPRVQCSFIVAALEAPPWTSGGVSNEGREEMQKAAADFNVHVIFSTRHGKYHADVPFRVFRNDGRLFVSGVSEGPLLYLRLPPGSYRISADIDGVSYSQTLQAPVAGHSRQVSFVAGDD